MLQMQTQSTVGQFSRTNNEDVHLKTNLRNISLSHICSHTGGQKLISDVHISQQPGGMLILKNITV